MAVIDFPNQLARTLAGVGLRSVAPGTPVRITPGLAAAFVVTPAGDILLDPASAHDPAAATIRHALELSLLLRLWPAWPALAGLAAARTAALFARLQGTDGGYAGADAIPGPEQVTAWRDALSCHQPGMDAALPSAMSGLLARVWPLLGPVEWLLRPGAGITMARPGTVSFASATGDVLSDRGYAAAEAMRQNVLGAIVSNRAAVSQALAGVRGVIRTAWGLPPGTFVALAASPVEAALFALAAAQGHPEGARVTVILMDPAEIQSGMAAAASGCHPDAVTARGAAVAVGELIGGYRGDTAVVSVALRDGDGAVRAAAQVAAECAAHAATAVANGYRVLMTRLDVSRTGLLAPGMSALIDLQARYPGQIDVLVDASQARLTPERVWNYLALGWMVTLSGSNFSAGAADAAALLVPETLRDRFAGTLPDGLRDYSSRAEWPPSLAATATLPRDGELSLALRWTAALAEMTAFDAVAPGEQQRIVRAFCDGVRRAVAAQPNLVLIDAPPPCRAACPAIPDDLAWNGAVWDGEAWDETGTVISFAMRDAQGQFLSPHAALRVHEALQSEIDEDWLAGATPGEQALAQRVFLAGEPLSLAIGHQDAGILSIAASTRLVSTKSSHAASGPDERLARAILDAEALLNKISVILRHQASLDRRRGESVTS